MCPEHRDLLGFKVKTLAKLLQQDMDRRITSLGLTGSQAMILRCLCVKQDAPVYSRDIERLFELRHPTVSGLLQRLEAKGFIRCEPVPEDRRCKRLLPTEKAMQVHAQLCTQIHTTEGLLSAGMTPEDLALLHGFLDRMVQNLTQSHPEGGTAP